MCTTSPRCARPRPGSRACVTLPGHPASRSAIGRSTAWRRPRRRPRAGRRPRGAAAGRCGPRERHRAHAAARRPAACATARGRPAPGAHTPPPALLAGQLDVRPRPRPERQQHRTALAGPGGQPRAVAAVQHPTRHDHEVQPVQQGGGDRHQVRPRVRDQRQALERDPRLGCGDEPEVRAADHPGPGASGRGLGEQRQHQRGGPRRSRDRDRRAPPQPAGRKQRGQRRDHREHPAVRPRLDDRVRPAARSSRRRRSPRAVANRCAASTSRDPGNRSLGWPPTPSPTRTPPRQAAGRGEGSVRTDVRIIAESARPLNPELGHASAPQLARATARRPPYADTRLAAEISARSGGSR